MARSVTTKTRAIPLSLDLERSVVAALLRGVLGPAQIQPEELSPAGKTVWSSITQLFERGASAPYDARTVFLTAVDVLGGPRDEVNRLLAEAMALPADRVIEEVVQQIRERRTLVDLLNLVSDQMREGRLDSGVLSGRLAEHTVNGNLTPVSDVIRDGLPPDPVGVPLRSLPGLSEKLGGVYGMWAIGGEPKVGKSTLAWQIALEVGQEMPVLAYDFENGFAVIMSRLKTVFGEEIERLRGGTSRLYYRDSIHTLESDLTKVPPPALIVIDSLQKLPASLQYHREGLVKWVHRLEAIKKKGYHVLVISEIPRSLYDTIVPRMGVFKETGEVEYSADMGSQMILRGDVIEFHVVAHRHRSVRGRAAVLRRSRDWWFSEV